MKKAFTLIELLAVLIILGVILAIIIPVTNGVINNSKQSAYDTQIEMLLDQALKYSVNNNLGTSEELKTLEFQDLINNGLISELPTNPKTSKLLEGCIVYSWQTSINQYKFEYSEDCIGTHVTYNKMVSGHDFNEMVTDLVFSGNTKRIVFESKIDAGLDLNSVVDLSLNKDKSIVGFISGDTLKVQTNGVIVAHESIGAEYDASENILKFSMFMFFEPIEEIKFDYDGKNVFDTSQVTNMNGLFYENARLKTLDLSSFDTSNVTDMRNMFQSDISLTSLDVSSFDTSKITDMSKMFYGLESLISLNLSNFDTSNVTNMSWMFAESPGFNTLNLSNFNTSNVTDMSRMFYDNWSLISLDISDFDMSNVTNMPNFFGDYESLQKPIIVKGLEEQTKIISNSIYLSSCNFITISDYNNLTEQEKNDLTLNSRC